MDNATLVSRVGGLVVCGFSGSNPAGAPLNRMTDLAGTILFSRNIETAEQVALLVRDFRATVVASGASPPIVAIDQEGGTVSRLEGIGTTIPSAMALGAVDDPAITEAMYRITGDELRAIGVTLDFAPVADVNNNPANPVIGIRSFGESPAAVGRHVSAAIRGLHDAGIAAAAKHFPGHGDTTVDSHHDLPVVGHDVTRLRAVELEPFRAAIAAGVDAIMTAHVALPALDASGAPATLSKAVLTGLLRDELGFGGVIVTDCMQMNAVADRYPGGEAAVLAIEAGADLIAYSSSLDAAREAVDALACALKSGRLDDDRIERSLARVSRLRLVEPHTQSDSIAMVGSEAHRLAALDAARRAITVISDPASTLPLRLKDGQKIFIVQFVGTATPVESTAKHSTAKYSTAFARMLARGPARVLEQIRSLEPAGHEYKQLLMAAASADAIVAVTRRASMHHLQAQAVADLALAAKPLVVVAAREPYDASVAPANAAVVASFGYDDLAMQATVEVLLGERTATGKLPVTVERAPVSAAANS